MVKGEEGEEIQRMLCPDDLSLKPTAAPGGQDKSQGENVLITNEGHREGPLLGFLPPIPKERAIERTAEVIKARSEETGADSLKEGDTDAELLLYRMDNWGTEADTDSDYTGDPKPVPGRKEEESGCYQLLESGAEWETSVSGKKKKKMRRGC